MVERIFIKSKLSLALYAILIADIVALCTVKLDVHIYKTKCTYV